MRDNKNNILVSLDLGTSKTRALAVELGKNLQPKIIKAIEKPSGTIIKKGVIVDMEDCSRLTNNILSEIERETKSNFKDVYVNLNGKEISLKKTKSSVSVARADGEITEDDVERVIAAAKKRIIPDGNRQVLHNIVLEYFIDDIGGIANPIGMNGIRLEAESLIVECFTPWYKNVFKCIEDISPYRVKEVVYNPLLPFFSVLSKNQKEIGTLVLDLGASTTNMIVVEDGKILTMKTIPIGGNSITKDIALSLKIPVELAEKVKIHYGTAKASSLPRKEIVSLSEIDQQFEESFDRKQLARIIEARLEDIFDLVNKELDLINRKAALPGGVVLVGGSSKMPLIPEFAREKLKLTSQIGFSANFSSEPLWEDEERKILEDPTWINAVGLIIWSLGNNNLLEEINKRSFKNLGFIARAIKYLKEELL